MDEKLNLSDRSYSVSDVQDYFEYIIKNYKTVADNPSMRTYVNKIENRITFKIEKGYYLQFLMHEVMKLLGSTKGKITQDENGQNLLCSKIAKVVLIHRIQEVCIHLSLINPLVKCLKFHPKFFKNF